MFDRRIRSSGKLGITLLVLWALAGLSPAIPLATAVPNNNSNRNAHPLNPSIHINQIGVRRIGQKQVIVSGDLEPNSTFRIENAAGEEVFEGQLHEFGFDIDSGDHLWRGEFTKFVTAGSYWIGVADHGFSYRFPVSDDFASSVLKLATRWFYLQRSGADKIDRVSGIEHEADHTSAAILRDSDGVHPDQTFDVSGGWWDAGDYGRYVPPATTTIMSLLYAYRFNPTAFKDSSLAIPESGNGVPDLLDEVRWELEWLLKMQRFDGAVHHKAATREYASSPPDDDEQEMYLFEVTSQSTAQYAGALAEASIIYRKFDRRFADKLLESAKRAWTWLQANPQKYPAGGFLNPDDKNGGDYAAEGDETGMRLWAAAALFHATGSRVYADAFAKLWTKNDPPASASGLYWCDGYAFGMFAYLDASGGDAGIREQIRKVITQQAQKILGVIDTTGYRVALQGDSGAFSYAWGSNCLALNRATFLLLANELNPNQRFIDGAAAQLDWVLGINPLNKAFITGAGSNPVKTLHHELSIVRGAAVPGAIGEGPNAVSAGGDPVLQKLFNNNVPFAKRYADDSRSWATNEPTICGNAAFVAVAAWFSRSGNGA